MMDDQLWTPYEMVVPTHARRHEVDGDQVTVGADEHDLYAAVDDIADGLVVFAVSDWPRVGDDGRLRWSGDERELVEPLDSAQAVVDESRSSRGTVGATRPLRVGDTFLLRSVDDDPTCLTAVAEVVDISAAARDEAKVALFGAVAPTVAEADVEEVSRSMAEARGAPLDERGVFDVRQPEPPRGGRGRR